MRCERLFNSTRSPLTSFREEDVVDTKREVRGLPFMHLAKNGGSFIEDFLDFPHWGHQCMWRKNADHRHSRSKWERARNASTAHFFTQLRHPIERLVSDYFFKLKGDHQQEYKERQKELCKNGTGKAYNKSCKPKVSLYEFGKLKDGAATTYSGINYQFRCLRPTKETDTIAEVEEFLLSDAWVLVGVMDQMTEFQLMLAQIFGLDKSKIKRSKVKQTAHSTAEELLTPEEYEDLVRLHSKDITLYYWALRYHEMMRQCYGPARLAAEVAALDERGAS